jgi:hypothetical protein
MNLKTTTNKMRHFSELFIALALALIPAKSYCCTSVIISGGARADGKPVMFKHRDTGHLDNSMRWFQGDKYSFIGLVNSSSEGGEVWSGVNSEGFCLMNTATYDLKNDDVPDSQMDKEGILMYKALGICTCLKDFEALLDSLPKPLGVEANFGIIDASGEAAYYEVDNRTWKKYVVADEPGGYMVVTNFTRRGRPEDRKGVDRFEKTCGIMASIDVSTADHKTLFNSVSRTGKPIMRDITSASVVFEGVAPGQDPSGTVMWTILGCPTTSVYVPLKVYGSDHIPSFMKKLPGESDSRICASSLRLKEALGFEHGCEDDCREVEKYVDSRYSPDMSVRRYERFADKVYRLYRKMYEAKLPKEAHNLGD